jgi:hypothetical protein
MNTSNQGLDKRVLLTVCGGAALMLGGVFYYLKSKKTPSEPSDFSRELILKVIKKFRRNYYPIYKYLWIMSQRVTAGYRQRFGTVPEQIKKSLSASIMDANPEFHKLVSDMETEIYSEFEIEDPKKFEKAVQELMKNDKEIAEIMNQIKEDTFKACSGTKVIKKVPLPDFVTKEQILEIYKTMAYEILIMLNDFLSDYIKKHKFINETDMEFNKELERVLKPGPIRKNILRSHNYHYSDEYHEDLVYASGMKQFSESDAEFKRLSTRVDELNNTLLRAHLMPGQNYEELRTRIEEILVIGIENTQPLIDVVPNAQEILEKKKEEEKKEKEDAEKIQSGIVEEKVEVAEKVEEKVEEDKVENTENIEKVEKVEKVENIPKMEEKEDEVKEDKVEEEPVETPEKVETKENEKEEENVEKKDTEEVNEPEVETKTEEPNKEEDKEEENKNEVKENVEEDA